MLSLLARKWRIRGSKFWWALIISSLHLFIREVDFSVPGRHRKRWRCWKWWRWRGTDGDRGGGPPFSPLCCRASCSQSSAKKIKKVIFLYNNNKYQLAKNARILSTTVKILEQIYNFFSKWNKFLCLCQTSFKFLFLEIRMQKLRNSKKTQTFWNHLRLCCSYLWIQGWIKSRPLFAMLIFNIRV